MKKYFVALVCALLLYTDVPAQQANGAKYSLPLIFKHITKADGLASNEVNCILQDHNGFMWFGTKNGLNRYDGRSFTTYHYDPGNTNSISGDEVNELYEDKRGRLWVGTMSNGLTIYNPANQQFTRFEHDDKDINSINKGYVAKIYEDHEGRMWICLYGGGLELFDEKARKFTHHVWSANDTDGTAGHLAGNKVKSIYETAPGKYLVGTFEAGDGKTDKKKWGHINQYDLRTNKFTPLKITGIIFKPSYRQGIHLLERLVHEIYADNGGNIWFGTYVGILKYDIANNVFSCYENDANDPVSLSENTVRSISEYNGKMFFGTEGGGISVMDPVTGTFVAYKHDPLNLNSLSDNLVRKIYKDKENRLWIATTGGGINIVEPENRNFTFYSNELLQVNATAKSSENRVQSICVDSSGSLYVGSDGGLSILNAVSGDVKVLPIKYTRNGISFDCPISTIQPSRSGKLWIGGPDMFLLFDPVNQTILTRKQLRDEKDAKLPIVSILELKNSDDLLISYLYLNTMLYSSKTKKILDTLPKFNSMNCVMDRKGFIWCRQVQYRFKEDMGLLRLDNLLHPQLFDHDQKDSNSVSSNDVRYIYKDKEDNTWIITNRGLDRYDDSTGHFIHLKGIKNFPDTLLNSMVEDRQGDFWFLTDEALIKLNLKAKLTTTYSVNLDLPVHKLEHKITYDAIDDVVYFTASGGIIAFHPEQLNDVYTPPPLFITDIELFNKTVFFDSSATIKKVYHLEYNQNFITINYTALNYAHPGFNKYAYKLEGLNADWNYVGNSHEANFTKLSPGIYVFRLKGSSREGVWDQESMPITIIIASPWWQTGWFYSACGLFAIVSLIGYNRYRTNIFRNQKIKLEQVVEQRTHEYKEQKERAEKSEQFNKQFLANMSHEIRTPMNAVMGMTNLVLDTPLQEKQRFYVEGIRRSSDTLLYIINDILDLSKIEAGKMELEQIDFSLRATIDQVKQTLTHRAEEKDLQLIANIDDSIPDVLLGDPVRLTQVLMNLTGNAIKFTEKGGVIIEVRYDTQGIRFSIIDTGIGIAKDKLETVFENFSQANASDSRKYGGTGLGLSISQQLVGIMGGNIAIESEVGSGTTFSFVVDFKNGSEEQLKRRLADEQLIHVSILDGLHILVVDDNEYNRIVAQDTLESKSNARITAVSSAQEAFEQLKEYKFDLVLMDVQMPDMNGFDATRYIREHFELPVKNIPIIALTASVLRADIDKCKQAGMDSYISKPFKAAQLVAAIAQVLHISLDPKMPNENILPANVIPRVTDLEYLRGFCEGDEERMQQYIARYLTAAQGFEKAANAAKARSDPAEIAQLIHSFKPKWIMMGMKESTEVGQKIEALCNEPGNERKLAALLTLLIGQNERSITELQSLS